MSNDQITLLDFTSTIAANQNYATHYGLVFSASTLNSNITFKYKSASKEESITFQQVEIGNFLTEFYRLKEEQLSEHHHVRATLRHPSLNRGKVYDDFVHTIIRATMLRLEMDIRDVTIDEYGEKIAELTAKLESAIEKLNHATKNATTLSGKIAEQKEALEDTSFEIKKNALEAISRAEKNAENQINKASSDASFKLNEARGSVLIEVQKTTGEFLEAKMFLSQEQISIKKSLEELPTKLANMANECSMEYEQSTKNVRNDYEEYKKTVSGEIAHLLNSAAAQVLIADFEASSLNKGIEANKNEKIASWTLKICVLVVILIALPALILTWNSVFSDLPATSGYLQKMLQLLYIKLSVAIPLLGLFGYFNSREKRARQLQERYHRITIILRTMGAYVDGMDGDKSSKVRMDLSKELFSLSDLSDSKESDKAYSDALKFISAIRGGSPEKE